jgi:Kef-type K+ transport system membrane component KefB
MLELASDFMGQAFASQESKYFLLIFALFIFPKFFVRLGISQSLIAFLLGIICSLFLNEFSQDATIKVLASLGIVSLFVFAGLEIDFEELNIHKKVLIGHILLRVLACAVVCVIAAHVFAINYRSAAILSLALLTPSAGFILDAINASKSLSKIDKFWIKIKAISGEIAALLAIFVLVNSSNFSNLGLASIALVALLIIIPRVFSFFSNKIAPYAPGSQFGFLIMLAVICGFLTKKLGVYYLVGAFAVGVAARTFEGRYLNEKNMLESIKLFSSFFIPFYFFQAGLGITKETFSMEAFEYGILLIFTITPLRLFSVLIHRKVALQESFIESLPIATALLPNLVFGLVLAQILLTIFHIPQTVYGALIIYTIATTFLSPLINKIFNINMEHGPALQASFKQTHIEDQEGEGAGTEVVEDVPPPQK